MTAIYKYDLTDIAIQLVSVFGIHNHDTDESYCWSSRPVAKNSTGGSFEWNVDRLFQPTSPGALKEVIWYMRIANIHEGL